MAKEKKTLTPKEQRKHHKKLKNLFFAGEIFAVISPYIAVGIANWNEYFIEYDGTKTSIAFILAMAIMGITITLIAKKKLQASLVTLLAGFIVVDVIFWLLGSLINDIAYIMLYACIGLAIGIGLDKASQEQDKKVKLIEEGIKKAQVDKVAEEYSKGENAKL